VPETYVHRIGRTARAGTAGIAISLCDGEEVAYLRDIEKLIRMTIPGSGKRADQRLAELPRATDGSVKSAVNSKRQRRRQDGLPRKPSRHPQSNHGQPNHSRTNESPRGIDTVAFMIRGKGRPQRDRAPLVRRWTSPSQGA
jgi:superfamily II DNA/RNA helicase